MPSQDGRDSARRRFLARLTGLAAALPLAPLLGRPAASAPAPQPTSSGSIAPAEAYVSFGPDEAAFVEALVVALCPADDLTPNGVDCGLALYMDRWLASGFAQGARHYLQGPWKMSKPEHGYQLPMTPGQFFREGLAAAERQCQRLLNQRFDALAVPQADAYLRRLADGEVSDPEISLMDWFNGLIYPLFIQACFGDPMYGGNRDKVFWRLIGYPGLPAVHAQDMKDFRGKPFPAARNPKSIADFS